MKKILALFLCAAPALQAAEPAKYAWGENWPRFRKSEYVVTGVALAGAAANFYLVPAPRTPAWRGQILIDRRARNALLIGSESGRDKMKIAADLVTAPLMAYAMLDGPITAGWVGGNKDTAIQLALINAETFAVMELLNLSISNALPRSRPEGTACDPDSKYDPHCVKSFWSGHTANVFTAASLVCVQHDALDLYGGKADKVACASALALASAIGGSRITSNNHHASDVIVGAALGSVVGYLMPKLLHFKARKTPNRFGYLVPRVGPQGGGLAYVKAW